MNIWEVRQALGLKETEKNTFEGVFCTGKFDGLQDYNAGILAVAIRNYGIRDGVIYGGLSITTVDDGVWFAPMAKPVESKKLADDITNTFGYILPTESELNVFLRKYSMYGVCSG